MEYIILNLNFHFNLNFINLPIYLGIYLSVS